MILYPARGADFPALAEKARETGGDGIYLVGYSNDMASLLKEIRKLSIPARISWAPPASGAPGPWRRRERRRKESSIRPRSSIPKATTPMSPGSSGISGPGTDPTRISMPPTDTMR